MAARALGGLGLFALFFSNLLPPSRFLAQRDTFRLYLPAAQFWIDEVRHGRFPTWWPYDGIGASFVGGGVGAVLSPMHLLAFVRSPDQALKWQILLGFVIAALGAARLARALGADEPGQWFAAVCFAGCGYMLSETDNLIYQQTPAFMPWVFLAALHLGRAPALRRGAALALVLALAFWSGDVQGTLIQAAVAGAIALAVGGRRAVAGLSFAAALLLAWCAPLLPAMRAVAQESGRGLAGYDLGTAEVWSLHPFRLIEMVFGTAYPISYYPIYAQQLGAALGAPSWGVLFSASLTVGTVAVIGTLALFTSRRFDRVAVILGVMGALTLWLALGRYGGLYAVFFHYVPIWNAFRYPQKLVIFGVLALAILGGVGLKELGKPTRALWAGLGVLCLGSVALAVLVSPARLGALLHLDAPDLLDTMVITLRLRAAVGLAIAVLVGFLAARRPRWAAIAAAVLGLAQVAWFASGVIEDGDRALLDHRPELLEPLLRAAGPGARICNGPDDLEDPGQYATGEQRDIHSDIEILTSDQGARFGLGNILSYTPANSGALAEACGSLPRCGEGCARREGAQWAIIPTYVASRGLPPGMTIEARIHSPEAVLVHDALARPLVSAPGVHFVSSFEALSKQMSSAGPGLPPALVLGNKLDVPAEPNASAITFARPRPDRIESTLHFSRPNLAVVAELASSGWHAHLDGREVPIHRVDLAMMGIEVPAGDHQLIVQYTPPGWPWAWAPYILAWLVALAFGGGALWRRRPIGARPG